MSMSIVSPSLSIQTPNEEGFVAGAKFRKKEFLRKCCMAHRSSSTWLEAAATVPW